MKTIITRNLSSIYFLLYVITYSSSLIASDGVINLICSAENSEGDIPDTVYITLDNKNKKVSSTSLEDRYRGGPNRYNDSKLENMFSYYVDKWTDSTIYFRLQRPNPTYIDYLPADIKRKRIESGFYSNNESFDHYTIELDRYTGKYKIWKRYYSFVETDANYFFKQAELGRYGDDIFQDIRSFGHKPSNGTGVCNIKPKRIF